jgi:molybdopterin-binding protein
MQASGSNILKGKVIKVVEGAVNSEVTREMHSAAVTFRRLSHREHGLGLKPRLKV